MMNGKNITGYQYADVLTNAFGAVNPATGETLDGSFYIADADTVNAALQLATKAFKTYQTIAPSVKASFLRAIATEITSLGDVLIARAVAESGLPVARITGEVGRTTGQLKMFADLVDEGSWVDAVIDTAQPERSPLPKPDIRRMMVPLGPVVVFGASNFPLAFSVAGGDTASALASGCPVIVKAHPAHPGTSALVAEAVVKAAKATGMPDGVFSILYDNGYSVGAQLVKHPQTKAVAFTGSYNGGMALIKLAQERATPIPIFTEMGSVNPVVLLPEKLQNSSQQLAAQYAASITVGAGQFCTNPGLILAVNSPGLDSFIHHLSNAITATPSATMLTNGIWKNFNQLTNDAFNNHNSMSRVAKSTVVDDTKLNQAIPTIARVNATQFMANPKLAHEIFGPWSLIVEAKDINELQLVIESLEGQLTATLMADEEELSCHPDLVAALAAISGRLILNNVPTGVEVCAAMQHGGPFPATSDSRFTSVGTGAVYRFVRPMAWQGWANGLLPAALQNGNPLNIWRQVNNQWTKDKHEQ